MEARRVFMVIFKVVFSVGSGAGSAVARLYRISLEKLQGRTFFSARPRSGRLGSTCITAGSVGGGEAAGEFRMARAERGIVGAGALPEGGAIGGGQIE
jgi:hypothetical protein